MPMSMTFRQQIKDYFLHRFRQMNKPERDKAYYLLLTCFTLFGFYGVLFLYHTIVKGGYFFVIGDLVGIAGSLFGLYWFRKGKIERAGKYLIGFSIVVVLFDCVLRDFWNTDPAIRYRLYITFGTILECYLIFISFFRNVRHLVNFTVIFIGIITLHFLIILHQIGGDRVMALKCVEHYGVVIIALVVTTIICGLLITMIETLYTQAIEQSEIIHRQNEELQQTVNEQTTFLVSSNESLKEFAYLTSHDLREPLRNISGFVSLVKKHVDSGDTATHSAELNEYFEYVHKAVGQMEGLISDIKEYSAINVLEKNFTKVNMAELMFQVRETLESEIVRINAKVTIQPDMAEVNGDRMLLFSLLQNLLVNAMKYRRYEEGSVVHVEYKFKDGQHIFSVSDNGIGIPQEYRERIFHVFKRLHGKDSKYEGTGLGLAICKKIVEIHGGRIWAESMVEVGSTFYFTLKD